MQQDIDMLNRIRQTTQMGQIGIRAVLPDSGSAAFHEALNRQYAEYDSIHAEADRLLRQCRGQARDLPTGARLAARLTAYWQHKRDPSVSKIAQMMIEGSTKGVINSVRSQHTLQVTDPQITALADKLLKTQQQNITQMQRYL